MMAVRAPWLEAWSAEDRKWQEERNKCRCKMPLPSTRCLNAVRCVRCQGWIDETKGKA